jgi:flagellin
MSGVISSINTNSSAMVALNSLNTIQSELQTAQTAVSTGYRVSSAVQDGAAYAVAQSVRSNVSGLTSANEQLGGAQGLLGTANSGLTSVSTMMTNIQDTLVKLSDASLTGSQRDQYNNQYQSQLASMQADINGSGYNGTNLLSGVTGGGASTTTVASNETGSQITLTGFDGATFMASMTGIGTGTTNSSGATVTNYISAADAQAALAPATGGTTPTPGGAFTVASNSVGTALNALGNTTNLVSNQITFNSNKMDALNNGIGALVDTNMAQESAKLQSLQIQQQLATSALSIANQSPSLLTKLFP